MTRGSRIALLLAAVAVAVAAFVVVGTGGEDGGDEPRRAATAPAGRTEAPARPRPEPIPLIRLRAGAPVGGVRTLAFSGGERIRFAIESDVRQEIHVHGYDVTRTVAPGRRLTLSFAAGPQGVFEVESHDTGRELARLRVGP